MTNPPACRRLPHEARPAAINIAWDEALLDAVAAADPAHAEAVVRTYAWSEPSLSLGYFQKIADADADPRWRGLPVVRRPTGGGALFHDREVTYAVVVPGSHPLARPSSALYHAVHGAIAQGMRNRGIPAELRGDFGPVEGPAPFLCFRDRDREDVVCGGAKIVGSAQRRRAGAVLQHGSLLLARSPTTPELPGLAELAAADPDPAAWAAWLADILPRALGLAPRDDRPAAAEVDEARRRAVEVYERPAWTRRR